MQVPTGPFRSAVCALIFLAEIACASLATAATRSGREVVEQVCAACHADGKEGAPLIGDLAAWAQRGKGGLGQLADHAIAGTGKMPAHGGQPNLSDLEISRAIAFMVTGGRAEDPNKPFSTPATANAEQLVNNHCIKCHGTGLNGAPRINQFADWKPRVQRGIDAMVQTAISGHTAMPARAGLSGLSDSDLRNAAIYMITRSAALNRP